jgi:hypothetical protein
MTRLLNISGWVWCAAAVIAAGCWLAEILQGSLI